MSSMTPSHAQDSRAVHASSRHEQAEDLIKTRQRVKAHGEVFTPRRMVEQMLDLVRAAAAAACLKYVKGKFARVMLGVAKSTQDNKRHTWRYVPLQDFTSASDIDWSKSIAEIDKQLYSKYKLDADETAFIESHVKPME